MAFFRRKFDPAMMREMYIDEMELKAKREAQEKAARLKEEEAKKAQELAKEIEAKAIEEKKVEEATPNVVADDKKGSSVSPVVENVEKASENTAETKQETEIADIDSKPATIEAENIQNKETQKAQETEQSNSEQEKTTEGIANVVESTETPIKEISTEQTELAEDGQIADQPNEVEDLSDVESFDDEPIVETEVEELSDNEWELHPEELTEQQRAYDEINCYINSKYSGKSIKKVKVTECETQEKDDGKQYQKYDVTVTENKDSQQNSDDFHFIYEKITARKEEGKTVKKNKTTVTKRFTIVQGDKQIKDLDTFEVTKDYELDK